MSTNTLIGGWITEDATSVRGTRLDLFTAPKSFHTKLLADNLADQLLSTETSVLTPMEKSKSEIHKSNV
jgi:hypothetical protein